VGRVPPLEKSDDFLGTKTNQNLLARGNLEEGVLAMRTMPVQSCKSWEERAEGWAFQPRGAFDLLRFASRPPKGSKSASGGGLSRLFRNQTLNGERTQKE